MKILMLIDSLSVAYIATLRHTSQRRWQNGELSLMTVSPKLAQARHELRHAYIIWRHAYIMMSRARTIPLLSSAALRPILC